MAFLNSFFWLHDVVSTFLGKHLFVIKRMVLVVAHLTLFGILFPELRKGFGNLAELVLLGILFLSPIAAILRMRLLLQLMSLRRELGILMAYLATVHVGGYFINPLWLSMFASSYVQGGFFSVNQTYLFGAIAYLVTLPLLFTSNDLMLRAFGGRNWKLLHRSVYLVLAFTLLHHFSIRRGLDISSVMQTAFFLALFVFAKVLAWRNFIAPLRDIIALVALRYRSYAAARKSVVIPPVEVTPVS